MNKKSNIKITFLFVLSVSLIVAAVITFLLTLCYRHICFQMLGGLCERIIQSCPDSKQNVLELLKTQKFYTTEKDILSSFGYTPSTLKTVEPAVLWIALSGFFAGIFLFLFAFWYWHRKSSLRIQALTKYLEKINTGGQGLLFEASDDEFSKLQDEIYKTVTQLYQTRDDALTDRNNYAQNLSNIAHQLKTPITSISLTVQMAKEHPENARIADIERQLYRLMHLEDALLLLSRIDAGGLVLERKPSDIFTILSLASENLYELYIRKGVSMDIPEMGELDINVDLDWTIEAVMNLMKNCIEAAQPDTTIHCSYEKNPLYAQIRVWDEGKGFAKKDLPHLFERFYRGEKAKNTGIGIGLSLSKSIIEMQNGSIRAFNLPNGGACFEIRFYTS